MSVLAGQARLPSITVLHADDVPPGLDGVIHATADTLVEALPGTEVLLVWDFNSDAVRDAWPAADALRWVHAASAGVDRLMFPELLDSPVTVTNSRGVFDRPIAEYVLGLVLAMAKDLPGTLAAQARREWHHRESEPVAGRRAVVVGGGPIGTAIGRLLAAVGMDVKLVGRREFATLPALLPSADWLVLAVPLTDATNGMLDADALALLRPSARVINIGRGQLVVEADLVDALCTGRIAGAALDVFTCEPLPRESPLWELPGVIVSPHMSGDLVGWREALVELFADNLARYLEGRPLRNVVDRTLGYVSELASSPLDTAVQRTWPTSASEEGT